MLDLNCILMYLQEAKDSKQVNSKSSKHLKSEGNKRNEKSLHAKVTATAVPKKSKDGKDLDAVASTINPKQPAKSKSLNDRQTQSHVTKVNWPFSRRVDPVFCLYESII